MRDEAEGLVASVEEAITIDPRAGVPVQISHHKAAVRDIWGLMSESLRLIEAAQARGESVHANQYPYAPCCAPYSKTVPSSRRTR